MKMKKVLTAALAATMVMASAVTASATTVQSSGSGESSAPQTFDEKFSQPANAAVTVGGVAVKTSLGGVYAATSVQGTAITTPVADVKASLGLSGSQTPVIIIYDTDPKKSTKAMECVNAAVEAYGGDLVSTLNVDLGAKEDGKWVTLNDGSVAMAAGLPKGADTTKTYYVICVQPGGVITKLEDQDTNPATVTFAVQAGLGTYAIVAE